jgi:hypothetical protein
VALAVPGGVGVPVAEAVPVGAGVDEVVVHVGVGLGVCVVGGVAPG